MIPILVRRPALVFALGCLTFFAIGWSSLLVPGLAREVEATFGQDDAGLGLLYLLTAVAYATGSLAGGWLTERHGRRAILGVAAVLNAVGLLVIGLAGSWAVLIAGCFVRSLGGGALDGGANALALDLYPAARGRALNTIHLFFSAGALAAPFAVAGSRGAGVPWPTLLVASGAVSFLLVLLLVVADLADGRHRPSPDGATAGEAERGGERRRRRAAIVALPAVALGVAIAGYVAMEVGVSNWLVRFLEQADAALAASALGLYWAGLTAGRLIGARIADRFDHLRLAIAASLGCAAAIVAAVLIPSLPLSIACFTLAGICSGPVYPLIMAVGGERFPDRISAMSGLLSAAAVVGSVVYPPVMGLISVTAGLPLAMAGTAVVGVATAGALILAGRVPAAEAGTAGRSPGIA